MNDLQTFLQFSKTVMLEERILVNSCWNMLKKRVIVKTTTNVDFELQFKQWNSHNAIIKVLFEAGSTLYQNPQIRLVYPAKMFQRFRTICR